MSVRSEWISLPTRGDARGQLIPVELEQDLPFRCRRVYFIVGTASGVRRGFHAHITLIQAVCCLQGSCGFLFDDGRSKLNVRVDDPSRVLLVRPMIWHEMYDFSADCVLAVFADAPYDEADYVRTYADFMSLVEERR